MPRYYGNKPEVFERINYMTLEHQAQVKKLIEEIEAVDKLAIPRIIMNDDGDFCWIRSKTDERYCVLKLGTSPSKVFVEYMGANHKLLIGEPTAEIVVEEIGSVLPLPQERTFMVKGRNLESGLPAGIEISSIEVREALSKAFDNQFFENFRFFLNQTPLMHHISNEQLLQSQIILRGTLSLIKGLGEHIQAVTGLKVIKEWN